MGSLRSLLLAGFLASWSRPAHSASRSEPTVTATVSPKVRNFTLALIGAFILIAFADTTQATTAPKPKPKQLVVKIRTYDGQPRLAVKRRVRYIIGCSKHCRIRAETRVRSPEFTLKTTNAFNGKPNSPNALSFLLPRPVMRYLRVYRANVIVVALVTAKDFQTGKIQKKRKVFRFRVR